MEAYKSGNTVVLAMSVAESQQLRGLAGHSQTAHFNGIALGVVNALDEVQIVRDQNESATTSLDDSGESDPGTVSSQPTT